MPQFMLILTGAPGALETVSPTDIQKILEKYNAWTGKLVAEGRIVGSHKLKDEGGKLLAKKADRLSVVDGPYSETKEVVGGYFVFRAANYDEAVKVASECPHLDFGNVYIREIDFMGHPET
jgi:hypothetical protein